MYSCGRFNDLFERVDARPIFNCGAYVENALLERAHHL